MSILATSARDRRRHLSPETSTLARAWRVTSATSRVTWRYRTELGLTLTVVGARVALGLLLPPAASYLLTAALVTGAVAHHPTRRLLVGRVRCGRTRRQIHAVFRATYARSGHLPRVTRSRVTATGESVTLRLQAGQSLRHLQVQLETLLAATRASDLHLTRRPDNAAIVTVDVVRRDSLRGETRVITPSPLLARAARINATLSGES